MTYLDDVRVLSARRAYDFAPDDIRLTVLCTTPVMDFIRQTFDFQYASIDQPPPSFGPVPDAVPSGLVFATGSLALDNGDLTPIRFLHIEPRRIVVDVAAPSDALDAVFDALVEAVNQVPVTGSNVTIGDVTNTVDYSGLTARIPVPLSSLLNPKAVPVLTSSGVAQANGNYLLPTLQLQFVQGDSAIYRKHRLGRRHRPTDHSSKHDSRRECGPQLCLS